MMGQRTGIQPKIFYSHLNLEQRLPRTHLLRKIQEQIDFNFIYAEVKNTYGDKGLGARSCNHIFQKIKEFRNANYKNEFQSHWIIWDIP